MSKYRVFSDPYFHAFGLNMERYEVSLRIQFECGKIRTRKNSVFGHFSHSVSYVVDFRYLVVDFSSLFIYNIWSLFYYFGRDFQLRQRFRLFREFCYSLVFSQLVLSRLLLTRFSLMLELNLALIYRLCERLL